MRQPDELGQARRSGCRQQQREIGVQFVTFCPIPRAKAPLALLLAENEFRRKPCQDPIVFIRAAFAYNDNGMTCPHRSYEGSDGLNGVRHFDDK
ncbi:hypothetical protein IZ6_26720 [Terrihabitans soli]|uniref:Uncharacterized protein n=1 Tax=Terrihabitans soli TaxID=708113 RepID=A0A6S6QVI4_9HYPH|nr:hypothetical protein IZ6_26720 [Terrihabitans soli]